MNFFYRNGIEPVDVEMMHQFGHFKYGTSLTFNLIFYCSNFSFLICVINSGVIENLETEFLRIPYKGENERFSMYILMPAKTPTAIDELLGKLTAPILDDVFNGSYSETTIGVSLPKFSIDKESDLESVC